MTTLTKDERAVADQVKAWIAAKEEAKRLYDRSDQIVLKLRRKLSTKTPTPIHEAGKGVLLVNNWARKTIAWGHGAARKYDLKIVDLPADP